MTGIKTVGTVALGFFVIYGLNALSILSTSGTVHIGGMTP